MDHTSHPKDDEADDVANPFSHQRLEKLFKVYAGSDRLMARESGTLELKQSFDWNNKENTARTMAGFANADGGYLVFGVGDKPRKLIGLSNNRFENIDPSDITQYLNEAFAPEIDWSPHLHNIEGRKFGIIYVRKSVIRPVVCTRNGTDISAAAIYFRYRGRTEKIRYPELRRILDEQRQREQDSWVGLLAKIARVGVKNAAVFDLQSGIVSGRSGSFVIDSSILPKLTFIREGEFKERGGAPAVRIIGRAEVVDKNLIQPTKTLSKTIAMRGPEIVHDFLDERKISDPKLYIAQICYESSGFFPVYYYLKQAGMSLANAKEFVEHVQSRSPAKQRLLARLAGADDLTLPAPNGNTKSGAIKSDFRKALVQGNLEEPVSIENICYILQMIRTFGPQQIHGSYLRALLKRWFDKYYTHKDAKLADNLRRSICFLDHATWRGKLPV